MYLVEGGDISDSRYLFCAFLYLFDDDINLSIGT